MHIAYKGKVLFTIITRCRLISYMRKSSRIRRDLMLFQSKMNVKSINSNKKCNSLPFPLSCV